MPKPIICIADPLLKFAEQLRPCFSARQFRYFVTVLLAMVECLERHTLSALKRSVAVDISLAGLSRFFTKYPWSAAKLAEQWWANLRPQLEQAVKAEHLRLAALRPKRQGRPQATVVTGYLIIDDSLHHKPQAHKMQGLGEHYSSTARRVATGHSMFASLYWLLGQRVPLAPQLYRQKPVADAEEAEFQSKVQMAVAAVENFTPIAATQTEVLADSWYMCRQLYLAVRKRDWHLTGGLKCNRKIQVTAAEGQRQWLGLTEYAASLPEAAWEQMNWGEGDGSRQVYVHRVVSKIRKLGPMAVLITKPERDSKPAQYRYFGSTRREADSASLIVALARRWDIEVLFEGAKDLLGSDEYQLMSSQAIVRYWTIVFCVLAFLEQQRVRRIAEQKEGQPAPTWGEMRAELQREHRRKLLLWLRDQFMAGADMADLQLRLAT